MSTLEAELERARDLRVEAIADAVESIGFECTRCGACCTGYETADGDREPHTATVFPDEVRRLQAAATDPDAHADGGSDGRGREDGGAPEPRGRGGDRGRDRDSDRSPRDEDRTDEGDAESTPDPREAYDWRDVARPMPYGLEEGPDGPEGETFEWALATDDCGDCVFYEERPSDDEQGRRDGDGDGDADDGREGDRDGRGTVGTCTVHGDRPLICRTYPFSVALPGTSQPMGEAVDEAGPVRAHECEGLGRSIDRADALELARALKRRAVRELEEAIAVRDAYEPVDTEPGTVVVHDSEGAKRPDGTLVDDAARE